MTLCHIYKNEWIIGCKADHIWDKHDESLQYLCFSRRIIEKFLSQNIDENMQTPEKLMSTKKQLSSVIHYLGKCESPWMVYNYTPNNPLSTKSKNDAIIDISMITLSPLCSAFVHSMHFK